MARRTLTAMLAAVAVLGAAAAARTAVAPDTDDVVMTGCVRALLDRDRPATHPVLVWSDGNVFLESVNMNLGGMPVGTAGANNVLFYWMDDEEDFAKYLGRQVRVVGELRDELETGELEIDHEGDFTEVHFEFQGRELNARVPTAWIGPRWAGRDSDTEIMIRRVDVEEVQLLGACPVR